MEKPVKKLGGSLGITIDPDDRRIYNISEGDILDITINTINGIKPQINYDSK